MKFLGHVATKHCALSLELISETNFENEKGKAKRFHFYYYNAMYILYAYGIRDWEYRRPQRCHFSYIKEYIFIYQ